MELRTFLLGGKLPALGVFADFFEAPVNVVLPEQFVVGAALGDPSIVHNENLADIADGGEAVGNGNAPESSP